MNWIKGTLTVVCSVVIALMLVDLMALLFLPRNMIPFNGFGHFALPRVLPRFNGHN